MSRKSVTTITAEPIEDQAQQPHDESTEGHGNHWDAVGCTNEESLMAHLKTIIQEGKLEGAGDVLANGGSGQHLTTDVVGISYPSGPMAGTIVSIKDAELKQLVVASGFPFCRRGKVSELKIERIDEWNNGVEAVIHTEVADAASVVFFDSKYFCNKKLYEIGKTLRWSLAGLAYRLERTKETEIVVDGGPAVELERKRVLEEDPQADVSKINSVTFCTDGMSAYFPRSTYQDDFEFRFKVKAVDSCVAFGQTFYILEGILFEPSDPVEYCMYVSLGTLGSYRPEVGDNVEGVAWLQGYLAE